MALTTTTLALACGLNDTTDWGALMPANAAVGLYRSINIPMVLKLTGGAVTGGSAANTLTVALLYSVYDTARKAYV